MTVFSKPPAVTALLLLLTSTAVAALDTLEWLSCDGDAFCGDLYFCCTEASTYGYKSTASASCVPGAGPTLRVLPGNTYSLTVHNTCEGQVDPLMGHHPNSTNLHLHGIHLSGEGNHDNMFRQVDPGNCLSFSYTFPSDYPPGTYWYHPHLHRLVLPQAGGGAFGLFIVDDLPKETRRPYDSGVAKFLTNTAIERQLMVTSTGMANGNPRGTRIQLVEGQWHYLRILHVIPTGSGTQPSTFLVPVRQLCEVYELATDGVYFSKVPYQKYGSPVYSFTVHAASRLDLAIRCSKVGQFGYRFGANTVTTFTVVSGKRSTSETPFVDEKKQWEPSRPLFLADLRDGHYPEEVKSINATYPVMLGDDMTINKLSWNPSQATETFPFGKKYIQQFNIINSADHPYHMHQQHFQVVQKGGCGSAHREGEWYDSISHTENEDCLVRLRFVDFSGRVIMHCHDLDHEDEGMMGYFQIPFAAPGSFESSKLFQPVTPQYQCPSTGVGRDAVDSGHQGTAAEGVCVAPPVPVYPFVVVVISVVVAAISLAIIAYAMQMKNSSMDMMTLADLNCEGATLDGSPAPQHVTPHARPSHIGSP